MTTPYYKNPSALNNGDSLFNMDFKSLNQPVLPGQQPGQQPFQFGPKKDDEFSLGDWTGLASSAANAYLGYQGLKLGRDQFGFAKDSFNKNLANQAQLINNQLEDRERAKRGYGGGSTLQSDLDAYLEPRKVSGTGV